MRLAALFLLSCFLALPAEASSLRVGSGQTYSTVRAAYLASASGDSILVYGGTYALDHFTSSHPINFRGYSSTGTSSPKPIIDGQLNNSGVDGNKGIWTFTTGSAGTTVDNFEFKQAQSSDGNGSGIRVDGGTPGSLTLRNLYMHDCQIELLAGGNTLNLYNSELYHSAVNDVFCGHSPPCFDHCIYVNAGQSFTMQGCYVHQPADGNVVKSRAANTYLLYNRIADENRSDNRNASLTVDISDGGRAILIGNVIVQSNWSDPALTNYTIVAYAAESASNTTLDFYAINNTIVNDNTGGTFISLRSGTTAKIYNNIMYGPGTHWSTSGTSVIASTNYFETPQANGAKFNSPGTPNYDYHLTSTTPASIVDAGVVPGVATGGFALTPTLMYVYDTDTESRPAGTLDIGAFEYTAAGGTTNVPVLAQPLNMTCAEGSTCDQTLTATDVDHDALTFTLQSLSQYFDATVTTTSPGTGTGTGNIHLAPTFSNSGTYTATVRVTDATGLRNEKTITITISDTNRAPLLDTPAPMIVSEGQTSDQTAYGYDPDVVTVTFSKVSSPSFLTVTQIDNYSATLHLAPSVGDAASSPYTCTLRISDGTLNTDKSFTAVVLPAAVSDPQCTPF